MLATLSPSRALREPRRIDWRALFGIFLALIAVGGSIAFWTASSDTRSVVVATRDVPAGGTLTLADLGTARVRLDDALYQAAVPAAYLTTLVGKQLTEPVYAHQVLVRAQLAPRPPLAPNQVALTVPISPDTAAGGQLRPGDAVEVLVTTDKGKPETRTTVVLARATVYDVGHQDRLGAIAATDGHASPGPVQWLTLVVTPNQAVALAQARWAGSLDIALLPPSS